MSLDAVRVQELTGIYERILDEEKSLEASQQISRDTIKEIKGELKAWGEAHELEPQMLLAVYDQYKKADKGKISILVEDQLGHVSYEDLLFQVFEMLRTQN